MAITPRKIYILPDVHIPSHDPAYLDAWIDFLSGQDPHVDQEVVILGDLLDVDSLKRFVRHPEATTTLGQEVRQTRSYLEAIKSAARYGSPIHYLEGNHEERLSKYIMKNAPHLWDVRRTMSELLDLSGLGVTWHNTIEPYIVGGVSHQHGTKLSQVAGQAAYREAERQAIACVRGHSHRQGWIPASALGGFRFGVEAGHLTDPSKLDYLVGYPNWQPGWVVETSFGNGVSQIEFVQILLDNRGRHGLYFRGEHLGTLRRTKKSDTDVQVPKVQDTSVRGQGGGGQGWETTPLPGTPRDTKDTDMNQIEIPELSGLGMREMCMQFQRSRRTIQLWVKSGQLPPPTYEHGKAWWPPTVTKREKGYYSGPASNTPR